MELSPAEAQRIWYQAAEKVKDRLIAPTLYKALEAAKGIMLDGDVFVVGFAGPDYPMASHLRSAQHNSIILQALGEALQKSVRLLTIEGTTLADYDSYKKLRAMSEAESATMSARRERERQVEQAWEEVSEKITRGYARLHLRQLAQSRGRFIRDAFSLINEQVNKLGYDDEADEIHKRSLSRVFERLAGAVEVPAAMLAYEFFKLRDEGRLT